MSKRKTRMKWTNLHELKVFIIYRENVLHRDQLCKNLKKNDESFTCSLDSIKMKCRNYKSIETGKGLRNCSELSKETYRKYEDYSIKELKAEEKKLSKNKKGFSFIEVLIVVGILGLLASIVITAYNKYQESAVKRVIKISTINASKAIQNCLALNGVRGCNSFQKLGFKCDNYGLYRVRTRQSYSSIFHAVSSGKTFSSGQSYKDGLVCTGVADIGRGVVCISITHTKSPKYSTGQPHWRASADQRGFLIGDKVGFTKRWFFSVGYGLCDSDHTSAFSGAY